MSCEQQTVIPKYLDLMDRQREAVFEVLAGMNETWLWDSPRTGGWCIGEILDHTRVLNAGSLTLLRLTWFLGCSLARLRRSKPYPVEIEDVYRRPDFPMNIGWMWPPRTTRKKPMGLNKLAQSLAQIHSQTRAFYSAKDPDILGHITLYVPAIGGLNLIQMLRVGLYHDQLHYEDVRKMANEIKQHTTPVA